MSVLEWNRVNEDLLAVGYLQRSDTTTPSGGLIALWSLKNPGKQATRPAAVPVLEFHSAFLGIIEFPQAVLKTSSGVTSLDFSKLHPNLMAVGTYDGLIAIFDVRKVLEGESDGKPELESERLQGTHAAAVWQVKWVEKEEGKGEHIVSISADGRVKEWSMKKGLTCTGLYCFTTPLRCH